MEYAVGRKFPNMENRYDDVPDIPDTLKNYDSFKFDRSIEKAEKYENGNVFKRFEDRSTTDPENRESDFSYCMTKDCVTAAARIISSMDSNIDPCDNFYGFTCGGFIDNTKIPQERFGVSTMSQIGDDVVFNLNKLLSLPPEDKNKITVDEQMARDYYYSCLDEQTLEKLEYLPLLQVFKDVGLRIPMFSPVRPRLWDRSESSPVSQIIERTLKTFLADSGLFGLDLSADASAAKDKTLLMLYQPITMLNKKQYTSDDKQDKMMRTLYKKFLVLIAKEIRDFLVKYDKEDPWPSDVLLEARVLNYMQTESLIAGIKQQGGDLEQSFYKISLVDLKNLSERSHAQNLTLRGESFEPYYPESKIDFVQITQDVIRDLTGFEVKNEDILNIPQIEYFKNLNNVLTKISPNDLEHYLTFRELINMVTKTTSTMTDIFNQWDKILGGPDVPNPRWHKCTVITQKAFNAKVSQMYVAAHKGMETRSKTSKMIDNLKASFRKLLEAADWMDGDTKAIALEKLGKMETFDGFIGEFSADIVSKQYKDLEGIKNNTYMANVVAGDKWWTKKYFSYMKDKPMSMANISDITFGTTEVNAMYSPQGNDIWVPLGIQNPPIFYEDSIPALMYGSLGMVLGHEITHGFDTMGKRFDSDGNYKNWWNNQTSEEFQKKTQCFVDQYNKYDFKVFDLIKDYKGPKATNGSTTLNENIADNGGMREAWGAYKLEQKDKEEKRLPGLENYSSDQLFFMSFGNMWCETKSLGALASQLQSDPHSPAPVRVKAVLSNMKEFQDAFQCKTGDKMVNENKCIVW